MGFDFTANEWLIVGLAALFGLLVGMALAAGGGRKHKLRYKDEHKRANELEAENVKLRKELRTLQDIPATGVGNRAHDADRHGTRGTV